MWEIQSRPTERVRDLFARICHRFLITCVCVCVCLVCHQSGPNDKSNWYTNLTDRHIWAANTIHTFHSWRPSSLSSSFRLSVSALDRRPFLIGRPFLSSTSTFEWINLFYFVCCFCWVVECSEATEMNGIWWQLAVLSFTQTSGIKLCCDVCVCVSAEAEIANKQNTERDIINLRLRNPGIFALPDRMDIFN